VDSNSEIQGYNFYPMLHFRRKFSSGVTPVPVNYSLIIFDADNNRPSQGTPEDFSNFTGESGEAGRGNDVSNPLCYESPVP